MYYLYSLIEMETGMNLKLSDGNCPFSFHTKYHSQNFELLLFSARVLLLSQKNAA